MFWCLFTNEDSLWCISWGIWISLDFNRGHIWIHSTYNVKSTISCENRTDYFESSLCVAKLTRQIVERIGESKRLLGTLKSTEIHAGNLRYKLQRSIFTSARAAWFSLCFCSEDYHVVIINTPTRSCCCWTLHVIEATVRFTLWYISVDFGLLSSEVQGVISSFLALGGYPAQNLNIAKLCYCCCICSLPT